MVFVLQQLNHENEEKHGKLKRRENRRLFFQEKHRRLSGKQRIFEVKHGDDFLYWGE